MSFYRGKPQTEDLGFRSHLPVNRQCHIFYFMIPKCHISKMEVNIPTQKRSWDDRENQIMPNTLHLL